LVFLLDGHLKILVENLHLRLLFHCQLGLLSTVLALDRLVHHFSVLSDLGSLFVGLQLLNARQVADALDSLCFQFLFAEHLRICEVLVLLCEVVKQRLFFC